ncbi:MAG TPA: hypothetical protein PKE49_06425 [Leptospiraceae bacterium]|nr:hypothetical protein [Leptospirales bacterium]HMU82909.1 hypothetical protein [Leptospiraceae bacterium]HMX56141.1 hypothetical protein [Leptospiraceae bacterium]HMY46306.1 hypothetical protein [Leptospiraceae bacterium]HMZ37482.1 hypothetical protein [Leptospiraceae bacterium]
MIPILRCAHPLGYKVRFSSGAVDCIIPSTSPYIYNQSTTAYAGSTVTGVVTLECRAPTAIKVWSKIATSNPAPGSTATFVVSGNSTLASYSVGDTIFCSDENLFYHKVTIL